MVLMKIPSVELPDLSAQYGAETMEILISAGLIEVV
jgi:hypothetical protein